MKPISTYIHLLVLAKLIHTMVPEDQDGPEASLEVRPDMLRELRSETTPWPLSVCLILGQGLNLGSIG